MSCWAPFPKKLLVTGGKQKYLDNNLNDWSGYEMALALEIDLHASVPKIKTVVEYETPEKYLPDTDEKSITFKSGEIYNNKLWVSTQTEVLRFNLDEYGLEDRYTQPEFNDVHHIMISSKPSLVVTSTGLDSVFEYNFNGKLINEWSVVNDYIWDKFEKDIDYRRVSTTKPHESHPNFCIEVSKNYWVTRFQQKDTLCLNTGETIPLNLGPPHDGILNNKLGYFTHVNGYVSTVDFETGRSDLLIDLNRFNSTGKRLGWCRGIKVVNKNYIIVGFSRIRPSNYQEKMSWLKSKVTSKAWPGSLPTRLWFIDVKEDCLLAEINLEEYSLNAIFSVLEL